MTALIYVQGCRCEKLLVLRFRFALAKPESEILYCNKPNQLPLMQRVLPLTCWHHTCFVVHEKSAREEIIGGLNDHAGQNQAKLEMAVE